MKLNLLRHGGWRVSNLLHGSAPSPPHLRPGDGCRCRVVPAPASAPRPIESVEHAPHLILTAPSSVAPDGGEAHVDKSEAFMGRTAYAGNRYRRPHPVFKAMYELPGSLQRAEGAGEEEGFLPQEDAGTGAGAE